MLISVKHYDNKIKFTYVVANSLAQPVRHLNNDGSVDMNRFMNVTGNLNINENTQAIVVNVKYDNHGDGYTTSWELANDAVDVNNTLKNSSNQPIQYGELFSYTFNEGTDVSTDTGLANPMVIYKHIGSYGDKHLNLVYFADMLSNNYSVQLSKEGLLCSYIYADLISGNTDTGEATEITDYSSYHTFMLVDDDGNLVDTQLQIMADLYPNPSDDIMIRSSSNLIVDPNQISSINYPSIVPNASNNEEFKLHQITKNNVYRIDGEAVPIITFKNGLGNLMLTPSYVRQDNEAIELTPSDNYRKNNETRTEAVKNAYNNELLAIAKSVLTNSQFKSRPVSQLGGADATFLNEMTYSSNGYFNTIHPTAEFLPINQVPAITHHSFTYVDSQSNPIIVHNLIKHSYLCETKGP